MLTHGRLILILTTILACACLTLNGCGASKQATVTPEAVSDSESLQLSLAETTADIQSHPLPPGIERPLYKRFQAELVRVITAEATKGTAVPPTGELNAINDLVLAGDDVAGWQLQWRYVNVGDYNLDGLVNASDLTPIGQHYEAAAGDLNWVVAQNADGNGDGLVGISDITPIGQNYEAFISGFNIYGAAAAEGPWELVDSMVRPDKPVEGTYLVTYTLAANSHATYKVVPYDSASLEGSQSWPCAHIPEPAEVVFGTDMVVSTQTIGTGGGTIVAAGGSPIEGVGMIFPPGALPADTLIELGYNDGTIDLPTGELGLPILVIDAGDVYEFNEPAQITVPFTEDEGTMPLAFYINEDGRLDGMQALDIDYEADTFTFETFHTSRLAVLYISNEYSSAFLMYLQFHPRDDEFWVKNTTTRYTDGNCLGMSVFAKWYFDTVSLGKTDRLYHTFRNIVNPSPLKFNQGIIATRAQLAVHRYYKEYTPAIIGRGYVASHHYNYNAIVNMLAITGSPQVVILDSPTGQHAVLVTAIMLEPNDPIEVTLSLCDPNFPGERRALAYNKVSESFEPYASGATTYTKVIHFGTGTIRYAESFDDILADAANNFNGSADATIEINSHTNGETVTTLLADLSGIVHSGEALVEELSIMNGSEVVEAELGVNGEFRVDLPMHEGTNYLVFHAKGHDELNRPVTIHNNLLTSGFTLLAEFPPAEITITSHDNGQEVPDRNIQLTGNIASSLDQVDRLIVKIAGQDEYDCNVQGDGNFSVAVSLHPEVNSFEFTTQAEVDEQLIEVDNDMDLGEYSLNGDFYPSKAYVEVTWKSTMDLALNLFIIHPDGEYSGYGHYPDGSRESHNFNNGYFTWFVSSEGFGTIQWGGEYKVRLQFIHDSIADPPGEDLPYTVRVRIHEGTPNEVNYVYTGVAPFEPFHHPTDDPDYWDPFTVRSGWTDACVFTPVIP